MPEYVIEREIPGAGKLKPQGVAGDFAEVLWCAQKHGTAGGSGCKAT